MGVGATTDDRHYLLLTFTPISGDRMLHAASSRLNCAHVVIGAEFNVGYFDNCDDLLCFWSQISSAHSKRQRRLCYSRLRVPHQRRIKDPGGCSVKPLNLGVQFP